VCCEVNQKDIRFWEELFKKKIPLDRFLFFFAQKKIFCLHTIWPIVPFFLKKKKKKIRFHFFF